MTEIFIVLCFDRHIDEEISVHSTLAGAMAFVEKFKARYAEGFADRGDTWRERDYGRTAGWLRYVESYDDGPHVRIERGTLQP